jgi:hypothetical protein
MRLITPAAFAALLATAAHADTMAHCAASWKAMSAADQARTTYDDYSSTCLKSDYKAMPALEATPPAGAKALCKDGTYSMSETAEDRCAGHGGVDKVL